MHVNLRPERRSRLWRVLIPFALVATAIVAIGAPAQAAAPSTYIATITPVAGEGTTTVHTFTITKFSGGGSIGSVNILVPTQFRENLSTSSLGTPTTMPVSTGKAWSATLNGSTIEIRAAQTKSQPSLTNGQSLSLTMSLAAAANCAPGSYAFEVTAKESRTFSGEATIEGNDPTITCYDQVCTVGACNETDDGDQGTGTNLQTTVPPNATLGINFHGAPDDACGTEETGLARVQLDPLNYLNLYSVAFFVPGADPSTDVCKSSDGGVTYEELSSCSRSNSAPCIASESGSPGGRSYVLDLLPGDPNIDFS